MTALHPNSVTESTDAETYVTREFNSGHVVVAAIDNEELYVSLRGGSVSWSRGGVHRGACHAQVLQRCRHGEV